MAVYDRAARRGRRPALNLLMAMVIMTTPVLAQNRVSDKEVIPAGSRAAAGDRVVGPAAGDAVSRQELMLVIQRLEERVRELESRLTGTPAAMLGRSAAAGRQEVSEGEEAPEAAAPVKEGEKAREEKENNGILSFFRATEISGIVDAYYGYNFNRPAGDTQLRNFDTKHNMFSFNLAELALEKKATPESRVGFRMDLNFGPATEIVHSAEPAGSETFKHLQQAYMSYLAPVGNGLQFDVGKFVTPHGAEVIETKDNWNYSRSLLFALAIPYYHFGLRASYPVSDSLSVSAFLVNGWNNVVDNNERKSYGVQAVVKPTSRLTITQSYMGGPEQEGNNSDWRHLWDTIVTYTVNSKLSLMGNYDYGFDRSEGARVHWKGVAAYARIQANDWLALAPRFEWYQDHDGFTTGARQTLKDFTITGEQRINSSFLTRLEYRRDFSDKEFFIKPVDRLVKAQSTLAFGLVYSFSSKGE